MIVSDRPTTDFASRVTLHLDSIREERERVANQRTQEEAKDRKRIHDRFRNIIDDRFYFLSAFDISDAPSFPGELQHNVFEVSFTIGEKRFYLSNHANDNGMVCLKHTKDNESTSRRTLIVSIEHGRVTEKNFVEVVAKFLDDGVDADSRIVHLDNYER
jgi:hypothetical protein